MEKQKNDIYDALNSNYARDLGGFMPITNPWWKRNWPTIKLVLIVVLVLFAAKCIGYYRENTCQVSMNVELNESILKENRFYSVTPGDEIVVNAKTRNINADIYMIGYYTNFSEKNADGTYKVNNTYGSDTMVFEVPSYPEGTKLVLCIEAVATNDDGEPNTNTKTGWKKFTLIY